MAEFPAFPVWTDAYLGDTTHLTTIEHGAYLLLLFAAWRAHGNCLPDDDVKLARYARMTRGQWARIAPTIREFFTSCDGSLYQSRLTDEAKHVRQVREKQREAGRASALKKKGRHSTDVHASLNGCATPSPSPSPTTLPSEAKASSSVKRASAVAKPDDVSDATWSDFQAHRKAKKAPITQSALEGIRREVVKAPGWTMEAALVEICGRGWTGFNASWVAEKEHRNGRIAEQSDPLLAAYREACSDAEAERRAAPVDNGDWLALPPGSAEPARRASG